MSFPTVDEDPDEFAVRFSLLRGEAIELRPVVEPLEDDINGAASGGFRIAPDDGNCV
jgi:hypothetical protein